MDSSQSITKNQGKKRKSLLGVKNVKTALVDSVAVRLGRMQVLNRMTEINIKEAEQDIKDFKNGT
jgi:hypothetical protein